MHIVIDNVLDEFVGYLISKIIRLLVGHVENFGDHSILIGDLQ